mmetsp:Transcript_11041/g.31210  ORF Transcript_11041/g.31210 Transcript_11041/m.31210 type:complete len:700 (-) Transcript_11041:218-2317(-)
MQAMEAESRNRALESMDRVMLPPPATWPPPTGPIGLPAPDGPRAVELTPAERERIRMIVEEEVEISAVRMIKRQERLEERSAVEAADQWNSILRRLATVQDTLMAVVEEQPAVVQSAISASLPAAMRESGKKTTEELQDLFLQESDKIMQQVDTAATNAISAADRQEAVLRKLDELKTSVGGFVSSAAAGAPVSSTGLDDLIALTLAKELAPLLNSIETISTQVEAVRHQGVAVASPGDGPGGLDDSPAAVGAQLSEISSRVSVLSASMQTVCDALAGQAIPIKANGGSEITGVVDEAEELNPLSTWLENSKEMKAEEEEKVEERLEIEAAGGSGSLQSASLRFQSSSPAAPGGSSGSGEQQQQRQAGRRQYGDDPSTEDSWADPWANGAAGAQEEEEEGEGRPPAVRMTVAAGRGPSQEGQQQQRRPPSSLEHQEEREPAYKAGASKDGSSDSIDNGRLEELMHDGLQLMREGRQIMKQARDLTDLLDADDLLMDAERAFTRAVKLSPSTVKARGNLGNTLLARGQLKISLIESRQAADTDDAEAEALLINAGRCFKAVLDATGRDERALCNWAAALVARAGLVEGAKPEAAAELYNLAVDKYEAVLSQNPHQVHSLKNCGIALRCLACCTGPENPETVETLEDALYNLEAALREQPEDDSVREELQIAEDLLAELPLPPQMVPTPPPGQRFSPPPRW